MVFPDPLGPTRATTSPGITVSSISCSTCSEGRYAKLTQSKSMRPSTGLGMGIASFGSSTSGAWSSKLKTRTAAPSAWLSPPYEAESLERGVGRDPAAPRNAMNSPTVNPPSIILLPPNHRTPASPRTDSNSMRGVITACTFTPRIEAWKFPSFRRLNLSISWVSMVKALITLIPERVS